MQQKLFALSLGFAVLILAPHPSFAAVPPQTGAPAGTWIGIANADTVAAFGP